MKAIICVVLLQASVAGAFKTCPVDAPHQLPDGRCLADNARSRRAIRKAKPGWTRGDKVPQIQVRCDDKGICVPR